MASKPVAQLSDAERDQLAVSYASFVISGQGAQVNVESLAAVLKAANVKVADNLVKAVGKALVGKNVTEFFGGVGAGSGSGSAPVAEDKPAAKKPEQKTQEAPPPPPEEEGEMDMGGLFD